MGEAIGPGKKRIDYLGEKGSQRLWRRPLREQELEGLGNDRWGLGGGSRFCGG
jgi:hypothetical protein